MKWIERLLRRRPYPERERKAALIKHLQTESDRVIERAAALAGVTPDELINPGLRRAAERYDRRLRGTR